jgi:hypothetical protein
MDIYAETEIKKLMAVHVEVLQKIQETLVQVVRQLEGIKYEMQRH